MDGTDFHRRYTGTPGADDTELSLNDKDEYAAGRLPKMSEPNEEDESCGLAAPAEYADGDGGRIMTTESESVANGFVRDGSSLPYVFETNEPG